jgi:hypothetical protein
MAFLRFDHGKINLDKELSRPENKALTLRYFSLEGDVSEKDTHLLMIDLKNKFTLKNSKIEVQTLKTTTPKTAKSAHKARVLMNSSSKSYRSLD